MARIDAFEKDPIYSSLPDAERRFVREKSVELQLTHQELRRIIEIAADMRLAALGSVADLWSEDGLDHVVGRDRKKKILSRLEAQIFEIMSSPPILNEFAGVSLSGAAPGTVEADPQSQLLGLCPVASPKTRCCNLLTLDAVTGCGFRCSYCAVQSFYRNGEIAFQPDLANRLAALELDPKVYYHIGTGQSSDSLMWGNRNGLLDALMDFADAHPNVTLELKTKSANVAYFQQRRIPRNVIITWSLNPQAVIDGEEHGAASLSDRLAAAHDVSDRGGLIGFHLHPMMRYRGWEEGYGTMIRDVTDRFDPSQVVMVSFGTMTFIKPVIKALRASAAQSRVLQMPVDETAGKYSYPPEIKEELMAAAYQHFAPWHEKVFFYLCMEDTELWIPVLGRSYADNDEFESAMTSAYRSKIGF